LRIASIKLKHDRDPQAAISFLRQVENPLDEARLRRAKRLFGLAKSMLDASDMAGQRQSRALD
jgi:hypothetical protein